MNDQETRKNLNDRLNAIKEEFGHTGFVYIWHDKNDFYVVGKIEPNVLTKLAGKALIDRFL